MVSWGINFPHKNGPTPFWLAPLSPPPSHVRTSKSPPNLYALPSHVNMTNMIDNIQSFPLLLDLPGKNDQQAIHGPTANFGPLSRRCVTNSMLITVFGAYLIPRSPVPWVWAKTIPILKVALYLTSPWVWPINA